ncbi:MAG TPA: FkbM family methyltransferase [Edaphobacter sp.]|jgi:FkbM family methyltransferase|nr:FkbM family methyltransferase [Edaphobacter sp.]
MTSFRTLTKRALGIDSWNSDDHQKRAIADAKTIFDVGANVGQSAQTYRRLYPQAEIWSFEPFPSTYKDLCRSVSDPRFHPVELAISDRIAKTELNIGAESIANSFLRRQSDSGNTIEVQTDTIDHFCWERGISNIDILKVDVEGAEERVFKGAREMFSRGAIQSVFVEVYFRPVYERMPLFWDLDAQLKRAGFGLCGLYSLSPSRDGFLSFGNALYLRYAESASADRNGYGRSSELSFEALARTGT